MSRKMPTSRMDARISIVFAICFAAVVAVAQSWWTLGGSLFVAVVLVVIRPSYLVRVKSIVPLIVLIWLFVPWSVSWPEGAATPVVAIASSGIELATRTSLRAIVILIVTAHLLDGMSVHELSRAISGLPLPRKLTRLLTLTLRFLPLLRGEFRRLGVAMACRGYPGRGWLQDTRSLALATGALLVRSVDRSERVSHAMAARTFGPSEAAPRQLWTRRDWGWFSLAALLITALIVCEIISIVLTTAS